jgi:predicted membrane protein
VNFQNILRNQKYNKIVTLIEANLFACVMSAPTTFMKHSSENLKVYLIYFVVSTVIGTILTYIIFSLMKKVIGGIVKPLKK